MAASLNSIFPSAQLLLADKRMAFASAALATAAHSAVDGRKPLPISAGMLRHALKSESITHAARAFKQGANSFAEATEAGRAFQFPQTLVYPSCCGELCQYTEARSACNVYFQLLDGFAALANQWKVHDVPQLDLLFCVQYEYGPASKAFDFVFLPLVAGRSGNVPPEQNFVLLECMAAVTDTFHNLLLQLTYDEFVFPLTRHRDGRLRSPLDQQQSGPICSATEQEYAKRLVRRSQLPGLRSDCTLRRVVLHPLHYRDLNIWQVMTEGKHATHPAFEIEIDPSRDSTKEKKAKPSQAAKAKEGKLCKGNLGALCSDVLGDDGGGGPQLVATTPVAATVASEAGQALEVKSALGTRGDFGLADDELSEADFAKDDGTFLERLLACSPDDVRESLLEASSNPKAINDFNNGFRLSLQRFFSFTPVVPLNLKLRRSRKWMTMWRWRAQSRTGLRLRLLVASRWMQTKGLRRLLHLLLLRRRLRLRSCNGHGP